MDPEIRKRLKWVELFRITGSASLVCLRCGISPPTRRKWVRRYEQFGLEGLRPQSRRPKTSPHFKLTDEVLGWIRELRNQRFGHRRIQCELKRLHGFSLALGSIHKASHLLGLPHLKPAKRDRRANEAANFRGVGSSSKGRNYTLLDRNSEPNREI